MFANNSLTAKYFSFFYFHNYGYENKKELPPDDQAIILINQLNSYFTIIIIHEGHELLRHEQKVLTVFVNALDFVWNSSF